MSRRRSGSLALLALVIGSVAPAIAEAQLLPNLAIRRQRADCCNEPPVYRQYRQEYYGYHPTCWRRFPAGWGCPSPEVANTEQVMKEIQDAIQQQPMEGAPPEGGPGPVLPGGPEMTPAPRPGTEPLPEIPRERAPFNLDRPGGAPGAGVPVPPATNPPPEANPGGGSAPPATGPSAGESASVAPASAPGTPLSLLDVNGSGPAASAPPLAAPDGSGGANGLPSPTLPDPSNPGMSSVATGAPASTLDAAPAPAPPRRSFLGGFFDRFRLRR